MSGGEMSTPTACSAWGHSPGRFDGGGAVSAADVEYVFAGLEPGSVEHHRTERSVDRLQAVGLS